MGGRRQHHPRSSASPLPPLSPKQSNNGSTDVHASAKAAVSMSPPAMDASGANAADTAGSRRGGGIAVCACVCLLPTRAEEGGGARARALFFYRCGQTKPFFSQNRAFPFAPSPPRRAPFPLALLASSCPPRRRRAGRARPEPNKHHPKNTRPMAPPSPPRRRRASARLAAAAATTDSERVREREGKGGREEEERERGGRPRGGGTFLASRRPLLPLPPPPAQEPNTKLEAAKVRVCA